MRQTFILLLVACLLLSCDGKEKVKPIPGENFDKIADGKQVRLFTLRNNAGMTAQITNFGGRAVSLWVKDKDGNFKDVVLGLDNIDRYIEGGEYLGALIGRYGNRIAGGKFGLNGKEYTLPINNNGNSLHGGIKGFQNVVWDAAMTENSEGEDVLSLTYLSKDGEEGYPGNLTVTVNYTVTEDNSLRIDYSAETDETTVLNLTHHSFFNLNGAGAGDINNHILKINADCYTPTDETLIPTGEIADVSNTPMDFREPVEIGKRVNDDFHALKIARGYDHNYVLNKETAGELTEAAEIYSPVTGIKMTVETTEPGMQFYGGNFLSGRIIGKEGKKYDFRSAFCLETQHFPDSPNRPEFPSAVLTPGQKYTQTCIYRFGIK